MPDNRSHKSIPADFRDPAMEYSYLSKSVVPGRMIDNLPQNTWADAEIPDWTPEDDNLPVKYYFYDSAFG